MRSTDQLNAARGDRACRGSFEFTPDLIDHNDLGVVVFNRLDHHFMLKHWLAYLHTAGLAHRGVRNIAVPANFVRRVHNDHALGLG